MGRMLETLKLGEGRRITPVLDRPDPVPPLQDRVVEWEIGEDVPYVEVGGPDKKVELSPGLQQHPPHATQPPHPPTEKALAGAGLKVVNLTETRPMTVALELWPEVTATSTGIAPEVIAYHQPDHATSKEYAALLDKMLTGLKVAQPNTLLLVGLKPRVGTSTVLLNLAATAAREGHRRVIVVDANGTRAGLGQRLGRTTSAGIEEVIAGTVALEQAIAKTALPSLHLLPAGSPTQKHKPLTVEAMTWLNAWLRERYDLVFIDSPTMDASTDVAVQAPHANGIYLVLPQGETPTVHKGIAQSISRMGGRLCGLIHTHFEM